MSEKMATREAFGKALVELADSYDFVVMDADLAEATKTQMGRSYAFRNGFPEKGMEKAVRAEGGAICSPADQLQRLCRPVPEQGRSARSSARDRTQPRRRCHPMPSGDTERIHRLY